MATDKIKTTQYHFAGFGSPTTTATPDVIFDELLVELTGAELKALLYIVRRTFGFQKSADAISFNQFMRGITTTDGRQLDRGCGVKDRTTLSKSLRHLEEMGVIISDKGTDERGENETTVYRLRFNDEVSAQDTDHDRRVVGKPYHGSRKSLPPVVGKSYPQQTVVQETDLYTSNSNREMVRSESETPARVGRGPISFRDLLKKRKEELESKQATTSNPGKAVSQPVGGAGGTKQGVAEKVYIQGHGEPQEATRTSEPGSISADEAQRLIALIDDTSKQFGDAHLRSNRTQIRNILVEASPLATDRLFDAVFYARGLTKEQAQLGNIRGNKMAYFFATLRDKLNLSSKVSPAPHKFGD